MAEEIRCEEALEDISEMCQAARDAARGALTALAEDPGELFREFGIRSRGGVRGLILGRIEARAAAWPRLHRAMVLDAVAAAVDEELVRP